VILNVTKEGNRLKVIEVTSDEAGHRLRNASMCSKDNCGVSDKEQEVRRPLEEGPFCVAQTALNDGAFPQIVPN
jgi:hypothetical protein